MYIYTYIYIYLCIYIYVYVYLYIYIHVSRTLVRVDHHSNITYAYLLPDISRSGSAYDDLGRSLHASLPLDLPSRADEGPHSATCLEANWIAIIMV